MKVLRKLVLLSLLPIAALFTACGGGGGGDCKTDPSFKKCVLPILNNNCAGSGCHSKAEAKSGNLKLVDVTAKDLLSREGQQKTTKGIKMVVPQKPNESLLYLKLLAPNDRPSNYKDIGAKMPPGTDLPQSDIDTIKTWIEKGAKDN